MKILRNYSKAIEKELIKLNASYVEESKKLHAEENFLKEFEARQKVRRQQETLQLNLNASVHRVMVDTKKKVIPAKPTNAFPSYPVRR